MRPAALRQWPLAAAVLVLSGCSAGIDAKAWPEFDFARGDGYYFSLIKIIFLWVLFLLWVRSCNWVNDDAQRRRMPTVVWNSSVVGAFFVFFVLALLIPYFSVGFTLLLLLGWIAPLAAYIVVRNGPLHSSEKVMTPGHMRFWLSQKLKKFGIKISAEAPDPNSGGPPIELQPRGGATKQDDAGNLLVARQNPGFLPTRVLLADAFGKRAGAILLNYTREACEIRFDVDGIWHPQEPKDRETSDNLLAVMKLLANLKQEERRAKQVGQFGAKTPEVGFTCRITSEGVPTGERVLIRIDDGAQGFKKLTDLGMRDKVEERLKAILQNKDGLVLFSAPPGHGLTTTLYVAMNAVDRLMRSFAAIEDKSHTEKPVDNVPETHYDLKNGPTPVEALIKASRQYPDGYFARDLISAEFVTALCTQASDEGRLVVTSIKARDTSEALLRVLMLKVKATDFAPVIKGVVNQRLVRTLCEGCKEAYEPSEQLLKQLGLPPGRVQALYRPPVAPEKPCKKCGGVGYIGRTAIFEVLTVDDALRKVLIESPKLDLVRKAAAKGLVSTAQQEGILLATKGLTSLEEVRRVLQEGSAQEGAAQQGAASPAAPKPAAAGQPGTPPAANQKPAPSAASPKPPPPKPQKS